MRAGLALGLLILIEGCGKSEQPAENQSSANEKSTAPSVSERTRANEPSSTVPYNARSTARHNSLGTLPPADAALRFVGLWAHDRSECASKGWRFTADALSATGGPHCSIYKVTKVEGGYDLAVKCPAKKPEPTDLIKLRFAESARAMLVESNAISPSGLIFCGK